MKLDQIVDWRVTLQENWTGFRCSFERNKMPVFQLSVTNSVSNIFPELILLKDLNQAAWFSIYAKAQSMCRREHGTRITIAFL